MQMIQLIFEILKYVILTFCIVIYSYHAWKFSKAMHGTPIYYGFVAIEFLILILLWSV